MFKTFVVMNAAWCFKFDFRRNLYRPLLKLYAKKSAFLLRETERNRKEKKSKVKKRKIKKPKVKRLYSFWKNNFFP